MALSSHVVGVRSAWKLILSRYRSALPLFPSISVTVCFATLLIYFFSGRKKQKENKEGKTKGEKDEHVISGFVSTAVQYPDHPHQTMEREIARTPATGRERESSASRKAV